MVWSSIGGVSGTCVSRRCLLVGGTSIIWLLSRLVAASTASVARAAGAWNVVQWVGELSGTLLGPEGSGLARS